MSSVIVSEKNDYSNFPKLGKTESERGMAKSIAEKNLSLEMSLLPKVIVAIPAFNEEIAIGSVVLRSKLYSDEVVVIDDGSTDKTATIARLAGATVIVHKVNQGKGA